MTGYHIDTCHHIQKPGIIYDLSFPGDLPEPCRAEVALAHPEGVSFWGYRCYSSAYEARFLQNLTISHKIALVEMDIEQVRRNRYPFRPSRFASLFAAPSVDVLFRCWLPLLGSLHPAWEIRSKEDGCLLDAALLDGLSYLAGASPSDRQYSIERICKYWEGTFSSSPLPELLLPMPCESVRLLSL